MNVTATLLGILFFAASLSATAQELGMPLIARHDSLLDSRGFEYSPDGETIAVGAQHGMLSLWDASTATFIREMDRLVDTVEIRDVRFSHTGDTIYATTSDGRLILWNTETGDSIGQLKLLDGHLARLEISRDGRTAVMIGLEGSVFVVDLADLSLAYAIDDPVAKIYGATIDPTGRRLVTSGSSDVDPYPKLLREWNFQTGEFIRADTLPMSVDKAIYSPDGSRILFSAANFPASGRDRNYWFAVELDAETFDTIRTFHPPDTIDWIYGFEYSPSGDRIVAAGMGGAYVWSRASGEVSAILDTARRSGLWDATFSSDDDQVALIGWSGEMRIWNIGPLSVDDVVAGENLIHHHAPRPNPTTGSFEIAVSLVTPAAMTVEVVDMMGRQVMKPVGRSCEPGRNAVSIDLSEVTEGTYWCVVRVGSSTYGHIIRVVR